MAGKNKFRDLACTIRKSLEVEDAVGVENRAAMQIPRIGETQLLVYLRLTNKRMFLSKLIRRCSEPHRADREPFFLENSASRRLCVE